MVSLPLERDFMSKGHITCGIDGSGDVHTINVCLCPTFCKRFEDGTIDGEEVLYFICSNCEQQWIVDIRD